MITGLVQNYLAGNYIILGIIVEKQINKTIKN